MRHTYKLVENAEYVEIGFRELKAGDRFKLVDSSPEPFETGARVYQATTDAYPGENGVYTVMADKVEG